MSETAGQADIQSDVDQEGGVQYTPEEQKAMARGWKPQDQFEGDPSDFVDAKSFNARGELMDVISKQSRKLKETETFIKEMQGEFFSMKKKAYEEAKADLLAQKADAMQVGDYSQVVLIDEKIKEHEKSVPVVDRTPQSSMTPEQWQSAFQPWKGENDWYGTSTKMTVVADYAGASYKNANPDASPAEILNHVTKVVRTEFPEAFSNQRRSQAQAVGTSDVTEGRGRSANKISPEERKVMNRFIKAGHVKDEAEWIKNRDNYK